MISTYFRECTPFPDFSIIILSLYSDYLTSHSLAEEGLLLKRPITTIGDLSCHNNSIIEDE